MRFVIVLIAVLGVAGCVAPAAYDLSGPDSARPSRSAARQFVAVAQVVEPVAETACRRQAPGMNCDFLIVVDDRPGQPPNAHQFLTRDGQPVLSFTNAMIETVRNADELAFVMGHEAAHHILGHLERQRQSARAGALAMGHLAKISGADSGAIRSAQELGATLGARRFSKDFELEADALGSRIAARAGFDAIRGAAFFARMDDPGNRFLGTHPPNAQRIEIVRQTASTL